MSQIVVLTGLQSPAPLWPILLSAPPSFSSVDIPSVIFWRCLDSLAICCQALPAFARVGNGTGPVHYPANAFTKLTGNRWCCGLESGWTPTLSVTLKPNHSTPLVPMNRHPYRPSWLPHGSQAARKRRVASSLFKTWNCCLYSKMTFFFLIMRFFFPFQACRWTSWIEGGKKGFKNKNNSFAQQLKLTRHLVNV